MSEVIAYAPFVAIIVAFCLLAAAVARFAHRLGRK